MTVEFNTEEIVLTDEQKDQLIISLTETNHRLRRANSKLKNLVRYKGKENGLLRDQLEPPKGKKQHFKNGKRGTKFNG
jgi:hypothetical protein